LGLALGLRAVGAACGNLTYDEVAHLALAETISFHPDHFHLVFRTLDHPLLSIYVFKFSGLLFGESEFGLRVFHLLFGTATVALVYQIGTRVFSQQVGLWAAVFLAADQFHASWSRAFMPEVLMLFFASLALLKFLDVLETSRRKDFLLLGLWMGLAYLAKETGILVIPIFWLFLLVTRSHRAMLWNPRWYATHLLFLAVIAPDIIWNLLHYSESYLHRDTVLLSEPLRIQLKPFSLYIGELFQMLYNQDALDYFEDYSAGNLWACHWPAGVFYLCAVAAAVRLRHLLQPRVLLIAFFFVFLFFSVLPGAERFDPFWWASLSLIPAVVLSGWACAKLAATGKPARTALLVFVGYLALHFAWQAQRPGELRARQTVEQIVMRTNKDARFALEQSDLEQNDVVTAHRLLIYALNIGGPNAETYYYLGLIEWIQNEHDRAESYLLKSLKIDPSNQPAQKLLNRVRSSKQ
jgi:4-amino-4-deoxy-L-arabinose transferase-like glycosyltransferase